MSKSQNLHLYIFPPAKFQISVQQMPSKWPAHGHWLVSYGKGLDLWMKGNLEAALSRQLHNMSRILTTLTFSTQIKRPTACWPCVML